MGVAAPVLWARGCLLAPFPVVPINTPLGVFQGDIQSLRVVVILFLGVVVVLFPSSSSFTLAIRVKRESVCKSCI